MPPVTEEFKAAYCIPYQPDEEDTNDARQRLITAYRQAWGTCLQRIQAVVDEVYSPVVDKIIDAMNAAQAPDMPSPYPKLPVIYVPGAALNQSITSTLSVALNELPGRVLVNSVSPVDCTNISNCMKKFVTGFLAQAEETTGRKATRSLSENNIQLLKSWHRHVIDSGASPPTLVLILNEIEQFDLDVIQDMLIILSQECSDINLICIILASDSMPSFLTTTYSISTLSLLNLRMIELPSFVAVLERIILQTFFSLDDSPLDLYPGPNVYRFMEQYTKKHHVSPDTVAAIIQLAYMRHFENPVSRCTVSMDAEDASELSNELQHRILSRLLAQRTKSDRDTMWRACHGSAETLLQYIESAHEDFHVEYRKFSLGVHIILEIRNAVSPPGSGGPNQRTWLAVLVGVLEGDWSKDLTDAVSTLRNLSAEMLSAVGHRLHQLFDQAPTRLQDGDFKKTRKSLRKLVNHESDGDSRAVASEVGSQLQSYIEDLLSPIAELPLSGLWMTAPFTFPADFLNPDTRQRIFTGLLHPHDYLSNPTEAPPNNRKVPSARENTDTGILFTGYLQSGRTVNVHDWFESFASTVDNEGHDDDEGMDTDEGHVTQARFMRALHELDYLGFIKHGGRKAEHVTRTVFDCLERP